jgi:hypothetical protein
MVREHLRDMSGSVPSEGWPDDSAPSVFQRASDVPDPLPPVRQSDDVVKLHNEWVRISSPPAGQSAALAPRLVRLLRRIANRAPGSIDREMIADLIRALDTVAARCDAIADRLDHQTVVVDDAITIFGEELTRLRAEAALRAHPAANPEGTPPLTARHD